SPGDPSEEVAAVEALVGVEEAVVVVAVVQPIARETSAPAKAASLQARVMSAAFQTINGWRLNRTLVLYVLESSGGTAPEEDFDDLLAADGADHLAQRAVDEEQDDQPELDGPEVWPDHLAREVTIRRDQVSGAPPDRHEVLQVVNEYGRGHVDRRLPHDVVDQRPAREAIDDGELVRDQHDLGDEKCPHRRTGHRGQRKAVLSEHQPPVDDDDMKGDEEENRRREHLVKLVLESVQHLTHIALSGDGIRGLRLFRQSSSIPGAEHGLTQGY